MKPKPPLNPQTFEDGVLTIYRTKNAADRGNLPRNEPVAPVYHLPFATRSLGDVRYYAALQASTKISRVVRIPYLPGILPAGDVVKLSEDDRQYRIDRLSPNYNTSPASMDLTLVISKTQYQIEVTT